MAHDVELAERIRQLLADEADVSEKKMFGGLAFLVVAKLAVSASGQGGLMVRVDPAEAAGLVATTNGRPVEMRGRPMRGWLRVDVEDVRSERELATWVNLGVTYARSLHAEV